MVKFYGFIRRKRRAKHRHWSTCSPRNHLLGNSWESELNFKSGDLSSGQAFSAGPTSQLAIWGPGHPTWQRHCVRLPAAGHGPGVRPATTALSVTHRGVEARFMAPVTVQWYPTAQNQSLHHFRLSKAGECHLPKYGINEGVIKNPALNHLCSQCWEWCLQNITRLIRKKQVPI